MFDRQNMFSHDQNLAVGDSTDIIDVGVAEIGRGQPIYLTVIGSGGATGALTVTVKTSSAPDMTGAVEVVKFTISAERMARGGTVLAAPLPTGCKRYLRLAYAGATGGTVSAALALGAETSQL